jgi:Fe-S cluster assembly ATP-binding protein
MTFLRTALNAQRKKRGRAELSDARNSSSSVREAGREARIDTGHAPPRRQCRLSGGEKKRNEILQMALLQPRLCVLDETDSGPRH